VDAAFIIIAWVGIKLLMEYLHAVGILHFEVPRWLSIGLIGVIFLIALWYARRAGPRQVETDHDEATDLLKN
jgi:predicted tellurium resistance membrane protein TerC